jgi:hypothetical protein
VLGDRVADVRDDVLEGELRAVDADDGEALRAVARVPRLQVRQRAQAVDARVRPEVDQDDAAAQAGDRQRTPAGRVEPRDDAVEVGRRPEDGQAGRGGPDDGRLGEPWRADEAVELPLHRVRALERADAGREARRRRREPGRDVGQEEQRGAGEHEPERLTEPWRAGAERGQPLERALPAEGEQQHRHGRAERVRGGHGDEAGGDALAGGERRDRAEHRTGARRPHEAEADAEQEAAADAVRSQRREPPGGAARERPERPSRELAEPRPDHREADQRDQHDGRVEEQVLRQPEGALEARGGEREDRERDREAERDPDRAATAAARAARQDDGQHRQDARCEHRRRAGDQAHGDQPEHVAMLASGLRNADGTRTLRRPRHTPARLGA